MTTAPPDGETELATDDILALLAEPRRRQLLRTLAAATAPVSLTRLAATMDAREGETSAKRRKQLQLSLYHVDVPKLEARAIVSYAESDGTVELGENGPAVVAYLDRLPQSEPGTDDADPDPTTSPST